MKIPLKKSNSYALAAVLCNAILLLIVAYEGYNLSQIYQRVNSQGRFDVIKHVARINFDALNKAAEKYKYGQSFAIQGSDQLKAPSSDPFANPVRDPDQKQ